MLAHYMFWGINDCYGVRQGVNTCFGVQIIVEEFSNELIPVSG